METEAVVYPGGREGSRSLFLSLMLLPSLLSDYNNSLQRKFFHEKKIYIYSWGTLVAQLPKCPLLISAYDPRAVGSSPMSSSALTVEPA